MSKLNFAMKRCFTLSFLLLIVSISFSQAPGIRWQRTIGGVNEDQVIFFFKTIDDGILMIGTVRSNIEGLQTFHGETDIIVQKFTSDGVIQWQRLLGGNNWDGPTSYVYNTDGSIVIVAGSNSSNGDITNNHGMSDIWLFKLNSSGNILWQRSYGGSRSETPQDIAKTADGGYIISGYTISDDGDVTGLHSYDDDGWIIKVNSVGQLLWQKCIGGTSDEAWAQIGIRGQTKVSRIIVSPDGSIYTFMGTRSNDGDVSGNHGSQDIWMVKFNSAGILQWQKCIGGTGYDRFDEVRLTSAGNFIISGYTESVELPSFHVNASNPTYGDAYICVVNSSGNLLWQKCYGSNNDDGDIARIVSIEENGDFVVATSIENTSSTIGHHGFDDLWILKLNSAGDILWDKFVGGSYFDRLIDEDDQFISSSAFTYNLAFGYGIKTMDSGYLFTASTHSPDIPNYHNPDKGIWPDLMVVKLSANGELEWQRCLGGSRTESPQGIPIEIEPDVFIVGGYTYSNNGDVQTNYGKADAWLIKFGSVNRIKGTVFIDNNGDGIKDAGDPLYSGGLVQASRGGPVRSVVPYQGNFEVTVDTGTYTTTFLPNPPYYSVSPVLQTSSFATYFNVDSISFILHRIPNVKDLIINIIPITPARPGFNLAYNIFCRNVGDVTIPSGQIVLARDPRLQFLSSLPMADFSSGDTLKWNYTNFKPFDTLKISLNLRVASPPIVNVRDTLSSLAFVTPVAGDFTPSDDTSGLCQIVVGSYDPNDKGENLGGSISKERVVAGDYITYFIRFQNTGTDTAFNVVVRDTLDNKLDWSSFQMITSSHPYTLQIDDQNKLIWTFYNIKLPDSNVNEPASHGYIAYRIKADNSLNIGATFLNRASIYFDFNLPVHTNFAPMVVGTPITLPLKLLDFDAKYQQPDAELKWITADESNVDKFIVERGIDPFHFVPVGTVAAKGGNTGGETHYQFFDRLINVAGEKFYYRLRMTDRDNKFTYGNIALVKRNGIVINEVAVIPNPARTGVIVANINYNRNVQAILSITDMQGRVLSNRMQYLNKGYNVVPLSGPALPNGTYFLQVKSEGKQMVTQFVISQ